MTTTASFIGGMIINCFTSFLLFGFKYLWKTFKLMRGKPWIVSQLKSLVMIIVPIIMFLRVPLYLYFTIYCIAALLYGIYLTYNNDIEYEKSYYFSQKLRREQELDDAFYANKAEEAARKNTQNSDQTQYDNTQTNTGSTYLPFNKCTSLDEVKNTYHNLIKMGHPDNGGDEEFTKFLTEQYEEACKQFENSTS